MYTADKLIKAKMMMIHSTATIAKVGGKTKNGLCLFTAQWCLSANDRYLLYQTLHIE